MDAHEVVVQALVVADRLRPARVLGGGGQEPRKRVVGVAFAAAVDAVVVRPLQVVTAVIYADAVQVVVDVRSVGSTSLALAEAEADDSVVDGLPTSNHGKGQVVETSLVVGLVRNVWPPVRGRAEAPLDRADSNRRGGARGGGDGGVGDRGVGEGVAVPRAEGPGYRHLLAGRARVRDRDVGGQRVVGDARAHERVADVHVGIDVHYGRAEDALRDVLRPARGVRNDRPV